MHGLSVRAFCANLAFLLFVACLVICSVHTLFLSHDLGFAETAARTDLVLSLLSCVLVVAISIFVAYILYRRRKNCAK